MSTLDRDQTMRELARVFSEVASGQPIDLSVGGVVLFLVAQCEHAKDPELDKYVADKLRAVADVLNPP